MRKTVFTILLLLGIQSVHAQGFFLTRDSLKNLLEVAQDDSARLAPLNILFYDYLFSYPDSSLSYVQQEILLAKKMRSNLALSKAYIDYTGFFEMIGDYSQALQSNFEALRLGEKSKSWLSIARSYLDRAGIHYDEGEYENSMLYNIKAKSLMEQHWKPSFEKDLYTAGDFTGDTVSNYLFILSELVDNYEKSDRFDSALMYIQIVNDATIRLDGKMDWPIVPCRFGNIYSKKGDYATAIRYYHSGLSIATEYGVATDLMQNCYGLANVFKKTGEFDSSIFYARKVIEVSSSAYTPLTKLDALNLLTDIYKSRHNADSVANYLELVIVTKDSLFSKRKIIQMQNLRFDEQLRQQEQIRQRQVLQNKIKFYSLAAGLVVILLIAFLLYRNNRHRQKANALLQQQKEKVETTLMELKSTQAQLIQSEKMASLGELTAGIAHEIQNPLNFVNNFSEVNTELIDELKTELATGNMQQAVDIADNIKENEEKIVSHGKRADAIVKGMLQHSRSSSGVKELTDINALADEYLRLAYHGLRAKDKSFNATMKTDYDETLSADEAGIGTINIVPQDIGRVILNLITNAFYAAPLPPKGGFKDPNYKHEPTVWLSTKKAGNKVLIRVKDNGPGIPNEILDKIFQPFFTTKPTGQGTGLGLSLAFDIVKAHSGEIKVHSKEGEGAEFVIWLPVDETI